MGTAIVGVLTTVVEFITGLFAKLTDVFWDGEALTFIGWMAIFMAGVAIFLLVFNLIRSFFPMRG